MNFLKFSSNSFHLQFKWNNKLFYFIFCYSFIYFIFLFQKLENQVDQEEPT